MESSAFSFQLKIKSCLLRETGTNNGGALKGFVKFNKYYENIGHISTVLCLASSNGGFRKEIHGWALSEFVKLHKNYNNNRNIPTRLCLAGFRPETEGIGSNDGVIIVDHGSRRKQSNLMLNEFVVMFRDRTGYPIVEPAHMELAEPSIKNAFASCVRQGVNRVIVSPFFLFPGRHWHQDIPSLTAEAAKEHPGVSYIITAPLALHELLVDVVNDRIQHCVSHVAGDADECSVCAGTGKCQLY